MQIALIGPAQSMRWLLCEIAGKIEQRREEEANHERTNHECELEDEQWCRTAEGLDVRRRDGQQLGYKEVDRLHEQRDSHSRHNAELTERETLTGEPRDGVQIGLVEQPCSDDFPAAEVGPERKAIECGSVLHQLEHDRDEHCKASEAPELDPIALGELVRSSDELGSEKVAEQDDRSHTHHANKRVAGDHQGCHTAGQLAVMAENDRRTFDQPRRIRKRFAGCSCAVASRSLILDGREERCAGEQRRQEERVQSTIFRTGAVVAMVSCPNGGLLVWVTEEVVESADDSHEADFGCMTLSFTPLMRLEAVVSDARGQTHEQSLYGWIDAQASPVWR